MNFAKRVSAALMAVVLLLPGGAIASVNVKLLAVFCLGVAILWRITSGEGVHRHWWIGLTSFGAFLLWSLIVGVHNSNESGAVVGQLVAFLSAGSAFFVFSYLVRVGLFERQDAIDTIVCLAVVFSITKIVLEIGLILGVLELEPLFAFTKEVFGAGFIRLTVGSFYRINFPADLLLPVVLLALLFRLPSSGARNRIIDVSIILVGIFISYSRYVWFEAFVVVAYWYIVSLSSRRISVVNVLVLLSATIVIVFSTEILLERFVGEAANSSDSARGEMAGLLAEAAIEHPLLGHGMGYYVPEMIRIPDSPWYYELQWLAFLMQFGMVGVIYLLCLTLSLLIAVRRDRIGGGIIVAYLLWLGAGMVNGFFLTSASGVLFFLFWLLTNDYKEKSFGFLPSAVSSNCGK